jgi:hypothetical protein
MTKTPAIMGITVQAQVRELPATELVVQNISG